MALWIGVLIETASVVRRLNVKPLLVSFSFVSLCFCFFENVSRFVLFCAFCGVCKIDTTTFVMVISLREVLCSELIMLFGSLLVFLLYLFLFYHDQKDGRTCNGLVHTL